MKAGRELDVKVAERLGWTEIHFDDRIDFEDDERTPLRKWVGICPGQDFYRELPYFQEDIVAAWELVEHLVGKDLSLQMVYSIRNGRKLLNVTFHNNYDLLDMITTKSQSWSDTAPIAICLAFLKATEG